MSDRGMLLALQRLHDDPGFADMVCSDPERTLGLYDLDDENRELLTNACKNNDNGRLGEVARGYGMDWKSDHIMGVGALDENDVSLEHQPLHTGPDEGSIGLGALPGDGYEGVKPNMHAGS